MNTPLSFSFVSDMGERLARHLQPPTWLIQEGHQRIVLLLNHVLMQEPEAMARLTRQKGRVVLAEWRQFKMALIVTPAGLLNVAPDGVGADLRLHIIQSSPLELAKTTMNGDKPAVRIEGDVQLAAEINWLVDHVRWDIEEDLSRIIGDVPAHTLAQAARKSAQALRKFVQTAFMTRTNKGKQDISQQGSAKATAAPTAPNKGAA